MDISIYNTQIASLVIPAVVSVIGWIVIDRQGRIARKEEKQMHAYDKIFEKTNFIIDESWLFVKKINSHMDSMERYVLKEKYKGNQLSTENSTDFIDVWAKNIRLIIDDSYTLINSIESYMRTLTMSGANVNTDSHKYQDLQSVYLDAKKSLKTIIDLWNDYQKFNNNNREKTLSDLRNSTNKELSQLGEFTDCLGDILVHLYNTHVAIPLGLTERDIKNTDGRRSITEEGLIDNRHI